MTRDELVALAQLLERTPMNRIEQLWCADLIMRLRDEIATEEEADDVPA